MTIIRRIYKGESSLYRDIRLASLKESPEAFSTSYQTASERTPERWSEQADSSAEGTDRCIFLALSKGKPIGVAALYHDEGHKDAGELVQVWVSPAHRGSGVASKLIQNIFEWAKKNGTSEIRTEVLDTNRRTIRFYERIGFEVADSVPLHSTSGVVLRRKI